MQQDIVTINAKQTRKVGQALAKKILDTKLEEKKISFFRAQVIALVGELGAGKTTFTQGFLEGLHIQGHYTSPTFVIMKEYAVVEKDNQEGIKKVFHLDAYRVTARDILDLGWEEIISNSQNVVIIEWADRIKEIIPVKAIWLNFSWLEENKRKIESNNNIKITKGDPEINSG